MKLTGKTGDPAVIKNASSAMPSDLKHENRWQVLHVFRDGGAYTANDVSSVTGISRQTSMKAIKYFCDRGLLASTGKGSSTDIGGKKPECFAFSRQSYLVCITMWPFRLNLTLFDLVRRRLDYMETAFDTGRKLEATFERLESLVHVFLERNHIAVEDIYGVGLSTAGLVDYRTGSLYYNAYAPQWGRNLSMPALLGSIFGDGVIYFVENAGKAIGRAVLLDDEDAKHKRVVTLFSDWGLYACMIERGHVLNGKDSLIGDVGRLLLTDPETMEQRPLEYMAGMERIREKLRAQPPDKQSPLAAMNVAEIRLRDVFAASQQGDAYARKLSGELASVMAWALHNMTLMFNPDLLVFHGEYAYADAWFDERLRSEIARRRPYADIGVFQITYDKRSPYELDPLGLSTALTNFFFRTDELYSGAN